MATPARQFSPLFWRERKSDPLQASAIRVDLSSRQAVRKVLAYRQEWQKQAIDDLNAVGELQYGVATPASLVSRIILFAATPSDLTDTQPVRITDDTGDDKVARDTIDRLGSPLTRADFQYDLAINFLVSGEAYVVCFGERPGETLPDGRVVAATPEHWVIRSVLEAEPYHNSIKVWCDYRNEMITLDPDLNDTFIRVWRPDPFRHNLATSHIRSVLGSAEELLHWDAAAVAAAKNRLTMAGLIGVPNNLVAKPEADDDPRLSGSQLWIARFMRTIQTAIQNPNSAGAAVPVLFEYPDNDQKKSGLEKIEFTRPQDAFLELRTTRCLQRIEQGINLPVGVVSGLGQATHWGGGQIDESTFRDHVEPLVLFICSALTRSFLQPILRESGVSEPDKYLVWYDASSLIIHRDKAANAQRAIEVGAISYPAFRRELGLSENDALVDPDERKELFDWLTGLKRGTVGAPAEQIRLMGQENASPVENVPGERTPTEQPVGPLKGKGQSPLPGATASAGVTFSETDLLLSRLQVMCDEKCRRALEKAGNKLRSRANKSSAYKNAIRSVKAELVASTLGPESVAKLGPEDLFTDAFPDLHARLVALLPDGVQLNAVAVSSNLATNLRIICAKALFTSPGPDFLVPIDTIIDSLTFKP